MKKKSDRKQNNIALWLLSITCQPAKRGLKLDNHLQSVLKVTSPGSIQDSYVIINSDLAAWLCEGFGMVSNDNSSGIWSHGL